MKVNNPLRLRFPESFVLLSEENYITWVGRGRWNNIKIEIPSWSNLEKICSN